jgi:hypothetical protein
MDADTNDATETTLEKICYECDDCRFNYAQVILTIRFRYPYPSIEDIYYAFDKSKDWDATSGNEMTLRVLTCKEYERICKEDDEYRSNQCDCEYGCYGCLI